MPAMQMPMNPMSAMSAMMSNLMPMMQSMMPNMMPMMQNMMPGMMPMMQTMIPAGMMPAAGMMPMPTPMMMSMMSCEMTADGMVCTMKPMEGISMDMIKDYCERLTTMMGYGMPAMMMCTGTPMMVCVLDKK